GHTNGDSIVYFPDLKTIHTGDLFVAAAPFIDYDGGGAAVEWTKTLEAALKLDFDTVIPGHGPIMKKADLQTFIQKFQTFKTRTTELIRRGVKQDQLLAQMKLDDL